MVTSVVGEEWLDGPSTSDTIYALSTAIGRAGVAIIRVSGPKSDESLTLLTNQSLPPARTATLRALRDPGNGELIDKAMVLRFEAGASFSGDATVEYHVHGGNAVVASVLNQLGSIDGLRAAQPGEFTRRAFENGALDLAQVEGLADLISAETELQRRQAVQIMGGVLSERAEAWRSDLLFSLAMVEATIDWADEEVPEDVSPEVLERLKTVRSEIAYEIEGSRSARSLREGFEVAIVGAPNVGKSSLINAISRRETSIISSIPGTTRDVIEVRCDVRGLPVTFLDTAGLRETSDVVEKIGVDRALQRARDADVRVLVSSHDAEGEPGVIETDAKADIRFWNKCDIDSAARSSEWIPGSVETGQGIDALLTGIIELLEDKTAAPSLAAHERVVSRLQSGSERLSHAIGLLETQGETELVSEEIRRAIRAVEEIVGRIESEDMLDVVFSQFCMGK